MSSERRNIGGVLTSRMLGVAEAVAAGTGDATEVDSVSFDRQSTQHFLSCKVVIGAAATLTSGKTLAVAANLQDSTNDSDWVDFGTVVASAVLLTATSAAEFLGVLELDRDLSAANRYVRIQATPDLSHTGTDTAVLSLTLVLGGGDEVPAS